MGSELGYDFIVEDSAVDVDCTLLSIKSDMSDTMFNMRDALHALPSDLQLADTENDAQTCKRKSKNIYYPYLTPLTIELKAPTSPATLLTEDSLTYLNQAQPYTIEISDSYGEKPTIIKSVVRICFYQERIQVNEAKHLAFWREHHPGERMLDIDHDGCFNCRSVYADPGNLNAIICVWHSVSPCRISLKAHCVSTEFTAKKHGGEKGVPFRLQVDSFRECDNSHIYSAACQVKVFKPKGADRKNRTDREKIDKRTKTERQQYRASTPTTFLEEVAYCPMSRLALNDLAPSASPDQSVLTVLQDFLSSSRNQLSVDVVPQVTRPASPLHIPHPLPSTSSSFRERVVVEQQLPPLSPCLQVQVQQQQLQCKRSAQDDAIGLDMGLSEISLAGGKTHLRQADGPAPLMPPPVKNGRLFEQRLEEDYYGCELPALDLSDVNVDALPFSQCEISENRVSTAKPSSSLRPIFSFSAPSAAVPPTNDKAVFKQPQSQPPSSQKRSTTPGDDEIPCHGTCSSCGRACSSFFSLTSHRQHSGSHSLSDMSQEWSVKRQRRKRQSIGSSCHNSERYSCVDNTPQEDSVCVRPSVPFMVTTSDYSSQTLDEENIDDQPRRPSTSSETSQALPSDEKSSKPPSRTTKSEGEDNDEEDFGEEGDDERSEGGCGVPNTLPENSSATPTSLQIDTTPSGFLAAKTGVAPRSGGNILNNYGRKARSAFRADMSRTAVSCWLRVAGFGSLRSKFAKFTGADMLRLSRRDLVLMCGTVEGIRLSNALLQKPPRAICTIFVRKDSDSVFQAVYLYQQTESELRSRLSSYLKLSVSPQNISIVLKKSPNMDIAVNDEMVSYLDDQSCYTVKVSETNSENKVTVSMSKI